MENQHEKISIIGELKGIPMIDGDFNYQLLLTLIAHHRANIAHKKVPLSDCVYPDVAYRIYAENTSLNTDVPASSELSTEHQNALLNATDTIKQIMPQWAIYFSLPVRYHFLDSPPETVSLTNHCIPQTIFLGKKAFRNREWLEEVIIHEMAHVWLGMICELNHFHDISSTARFVLPSGTRGKDARGVIFAGHFAAAVISYFKEKRKKHACSESRKERIIYLKNYLAGCLDLLEQDSSLNKTGTELFCRLKNFEVAHG